MSKYRFMAITMGRDAGGLGGKRTASDIAVGWHNHGAIDSALSHRDEWTGNNNSERSKLDLGIQVYQSWLYVWRFLVKCSLICRR
jgi:hypothetical protein